MDPLKSPIIRSQDIPLIGMTSLDCLSKIVVSSPVSGRGQSTASYVPADYTVRFEHKTEKKLRIEYKRGEIQVLFDQLENKITTSIGMGSRFISFKQSQTFSGDSEAFTFNVRYNLLGDFDWNEAPEDRDIRDNVEIRYFWRQWGKGSENPIEKSLTFTLVSNVEDVEAGHTGNITWATQQPEEGMSHDQAPSRAVLMAWALPEAPYDVAPPPGRQESAYYHAQFYTELEKIVEVLGRFHDSYYRKSVNKLRQLDRRFQVSRKKVSY